MSTKRLFLSLIAVCLFSCFALPQGSQPAVKDIYRGFVGTWEGTRLILKDGNYVQTPIEIVAHEDEKKHRLILEYRFGGPKGTDVANKILELNVDRSIFLSYYEGDEHDRYKATGLEELRLNGIGDFSGLSDSYDFKGNRVTDRLTFHLGVDTLKFEVEQTADGQNYKTISTHSFKRKT